MAKITRKQAEKRVKAALSGASCRGPLLLTDLEMARFSARREAAESDQYFLEQLVEDLERYVNLVAEKRHDVDVDITGPPIDWETDTLEVVDARIMGLIFSRMDRIGRACGHKIVDVVLSNPFDGKQRDYTCPGCGRPGHYTAPTFAGLRE